MGQTLEICTAGGNGMAHLDPRGHWASFALATFAPQPRRPCRSEDKERNMNGLVSVTHLQRKKNEPLVTANLPTGRSPSSGPPPRMRCASLAMARLDPRPVHPWKTENEQKKVNDLILDDRIFDCSAIAGRNWRRRNLGAAGLTASSRSIEEPAGSRAGHSNDRPSCDV